MSFDLGSDDVLDFENPNRELRLKIYEQQAEILGGEEALPQGFRDYFTNTHFASIREMVTQMIAHSTDAKANSWDAPDPKASNVSIPLFQSAVSCGFPSPAEDYVEKYLSLDKELIKHPAATFFVRAIGDSMAPLIQEGDLLVVDRSLEARSGMLVLATLEGQFTAKRLLLSPKAARLQAENPAYRDILIEEGEGDTRQFSIWGVITYVIHKTVEPHQASQRQAQPPGEAH